MWWWAMHYRHLPTYDAQGKDGHAKPPPAGLPWHTGLCRAVLACLAFAMSVLFVPMVHEVVVTLRHSALVRSRLQAMGSHALGLAAESRLHTHVQPLPSPGLPGCAHAYGAGHGVRLAGRYALLASVAEVVQRGSNAIDKYAMGALKLRVALGNRTAAAGIDTILLVPSTSATCVDAGRGGMGNGLHLAFMAGWDAVCCVAPGILGMGGKEDLREVPRHFGHVFDRFLAWGLTGYSLVMYMDSDTVIMQPDGVVRSFPGVLDGMQQGNNLFYACRKERNFKNCNSGVFFARPNPEVLQGLVGVARECYGSNARARLPWQYTNSDGQAIFVPRGHDPMHTNCWSDQGVLDAYFTRLSPSSDTSDRAQYPLPLSLNTISYEAYEVFGARSVQDLHGVAILHLIRPKPWNVWECDSWWGLEEWCDLWRRQPLVQGQQPAPPSTLPLRAPSQ